MRFAILLTAAGFLLMDSPFAAAQGPAFRPGPSGGGSGSYNPSASSVSPYLNLLRSGSSPAVNYYGLVRPAIDFQNNLNNLQQQVQNLPSPGTGMGTDPFGPLVTSGRVRYLNTGSYFLNGNQAGSLRGTSGSGSVIVLNQGSSAMGQGAKGTGGSVATTPAAPRR